MTQQEYDKIQKEMCMKLRFMDTTINGISETQEYKEACAYNNAIRDCMDLLKNHVTQEKT